jgi:hypothetical protein
MCGPPPESRAKDSGPPGDRTQDTVIKSRARWSVPKGLLSILLDNLESRWPCEDSRSPIRTASGPTAVPRIRPGCVAGQKGRGFKSRPRNHSIFPINIDRNAPAESRGRGGGDSNTGTSSLADRNRTGRWSAVIASTRRNSGASMISRQWPTPTLHWRPGSSGTTTSASRWRSTAVRRRRNWRPSKPLSQRSYSE